MNKTALHIGKYTFSYDEVLGTLAEETGKILSADVKKISEGEFSVLVDGKSFHIFMKQSVDQYSATVNNFVFDIETETLRDKLAKQLQKESGLNISSVTVRAPMPGLITKILISEGASVTIGQGLLVMEAMKMENEIKSAKNGTVKKVFVQEKTTVEKNDQLIIIE